MSGRVKTRNGGSSKAAASPAARTDKMEECDGLRLLDLLRARGARSWHSAVPVAEVVRALGGTADGWFMLGRNLESRHFFILLRFDELSGAEQGFYVARDRAAVKENCASLRFASGCLLYRAAQVEDMLDDSFLPKGKSEDDDDTGPPVKAGRRVSAA